MRRSPLALISPAKLRQLRHVPRTVRMFRDWQPLLINWAGFADAPAKYRLRDGGVIHAREGMDAATIGVVVVRRDYGLPPADAATILDIGGNIGSFTFLAARFAPSARVFAFEPDPAAREMMQRTVNDNGLSDRVEVSSCGVAGQDGPRTLCVSEHTAFNSLYGNVDPDSCMTIQCVSLESVFASHGIESVDLLKIDCEGCEYEILGTASDDVIGRIAEIRMEYHNLDGVEGGNIESLTQLLARRGFERTLIRRDEPTSGIAWFTRSTEGE